MCAFDFCWLVVLVESVRSGLGSLARRHQPDRQTFLDRWSSGPPGPFRHKVAQREAEHRPTELFRARGAKSNGTGRGPNERGLPTYLFLPTFGCLSLAHDPGRRAHVELLARKNVANCVTFCNIFHEGIYLHNLGYFGEGPALNMCTANITAWSSGYKAIIEGYFADKIVAIQEHKLTTMEGIKKAKDQAQNYGLRVELSLGIRTIKGGFSSGVGFIWPKHIEVRNPGKLFNEARMYSIEVCHDVFGVINILSFYGVTGDQEKTCANLRRAFQVLDATRCPYVICGDFNMEASDMCTRLGEWKSLSRLVHGGLSCFSGESVSTIDYFIVSQMFRAQNIVCMTMETRLATHRPVVMKWEAFKSPTRVKWVDKTPRPLSDILFGPKISHSWDIWTAQMTALSQAFSISDTTNFGSLKGCGKFAANMEQLWNDWLTGAEVEIRANFGVETKNRPGAAFVVKQGSLEQALASREGKCIQTLKATRLAWRRCQEVVSHHGKSNIGYP